MRRLMLWSVALAAGLGLAASVSYAEQVVLSQGEVLEGASYEGVRDVVLIAGTFAPKHYGGGSTLWIGTGPGEDAALRRSLLAFDLEGLPASARKRAVRRAVIRLVCTQASGDPFIWQAYAVLPENAVWLQEEGTTGRSEGKALANVCSWNYRVNFYQEWTGGPGLGEPGSGYADTPFFEHSSGRETVQAGSVVEMEVPIEVVEKWMSGVNGGVLIRMQEEGETAGQYIRFGSSEHPEHGKRPVLEIEFE